MISQEFYRKESYREQLEAFDDEQLADYILEKGGEIEALEGSVDVALNVLSERGVSLGEVLDGRE